MTDLPKLTYRDFEIEMTGPRQEDGAYLVRVSGRTPDGSDMRADQAEPVAIVPTVLEPLVQRLDRRRLTKEEFLAFGETLGNHLLPGQVRSLFERSLDHVRRKQEGLRLRLRIEPLALAALPWEYALVRHSAGEATTAGFLCLQPDISIVRHEALGTPLEPAASKDTYRLVVALASPTSQAELKLEEDERAIAAAVKGINRSSEVVEIVALNQATRDKLLPALAGADIFHFSGHGVFEQGAELTASGNLRGRGAILLEKDGGDEDRYDTDLLANALQEADVRLVVLGACNTATRDAGGAWTGVAPALVGLDIPAVVAMQFKLADVRAAQFLAPLYLRVLQGYSIDQAVAQARRALFNETGQELGDWAKDRDWGTAVLYLRAPDGVLFPEPESTFTEAVGPGGAPILTARMKIKTVSGTAIAIEAGDVTTGSLNADMEIGDVPAGGKAVGIKVGNIGGSGARSTRRRERGEDED